MSRKQECWIIMKINSISCSLFISLPLNSISLLRVMASILLLQYENNRSVFSTPGDYGTSQQSPFFDLIFDSYYIASFFTLMPTTIVWVTCPVIDSVKTAGVCCGIHMWSRCYPTVSPTSSLLATPVSRSSSPCSHFSHVASLLRDNKTIL